MIALDKIEKFYGNNQILDGICCELPQGKVTAIVGENGSGKSTLLSILGKYLSPNDGGVFVDGLHYTTYTKESYALKVASLRQFNQINSKITVKEFVSFARYPHSKNRLTDEDYRVVDKCLEVLGCLDLQNRYINELSGGQAQRVFLAAIFAQDTPIILLDEPLNNLDLKHAHDLMKIIKNFAKNENKTVVIIMHDINMVYQYADYVLALKDGKIVHCGEVKSFECPKILNKIFDLEFSLLQIQNRCVAYLKEGSL